MLSKILGYASPTFYSVCVMLGRLKPNNFHLIEVDRFYLLFMTGSEINHSFLFHCVIKILTACRILKISIARCQIEPEIHSFPTMYIMRGGKYVRNGSNR